MKNRKIKIIALHTFVLLLIGCETVQGQTRKRVKAPYTATCLHPKCSKAAPYSSRTLMVCDYHSRHKASAAELSLLSAIKTKNHSKLKELLKTVDPNFLGDDALPPIFWAVNKSDLAAIKLLAASGAVLNWTRADGNSLVFDAAYKRDADIVDYLKKNQVSTRGERLGSITRIFTDKGKDMLKNPSKYQRPQSSGKCHRCSGSGSIGTGNSYTNCPECNGSGKN